MNYVAEYEVVISESGMKGIACELLRELDESVNIIVGIDEQIARRIMFMVDSGLNANESLEEDLPGIKNLFNRDNYDVIIRRNDFYDLDEEVYVHKKFK